MKEQEIPEEDDYGLPAELSTRKAAEILGVTPITVLRLIASGGIPATKLESKAEGAVGPGYRWSIPRKAVFERAGESRVIAWARVGNRDLLPRVARLERIVTENQWRMLEWFDRIIKAEGIISRLEAVEAKLGLAGTPSPAPKPPA